MNHFKFLNNLFGWVVFTIATIVYLLTIEPTASWWDCGEYIATAYKLQVGHPPGAPMFQLIGRFFSLFAFGDVTHVAMMINVMSALSSSFTILFLFWTITMLGRKLIPAGEGESNPIRMYAVLASGVVGALAYTFSDSFWFSAVEGEVYAMSSFFTALVFWAILKWEAVADQKHAYRWLIFIAFMIGLSIGVHMLNLLAIPAITLVFYYKKFKPSRKGMILTLTISILILSFIMYVIIPYTVEMIGNFELFFVNSLGMPFNSGTIIFFLLLIGAIIFGLWHSRKNNRVILNTAILVFVFILIGYSSFFVLIIRANANTPINENDPRDAISMLSYLNREQYGSWPIFKGQYYNAPVVEYGDGNPVYIKDIKKGKYVITDDRKGTIPIYDPRFTTIFPRMWSDQRKGAAEFYQNWGGASGTPIAVTGRDGETETLIKPSFSNNLQFLITYQVGWMYFRYFMWNFAGRQNDVQGFGNINDGNWLSGIPFLDKPRLGTQDNLPESMQNRAQNKLYLLPLILGLIGFYYHFKKNSADGLTILMLFLMTGLAIVFYLNQQPFEPRERDYAYAGSFYAFAIWIGLGVMALFDWLSKAVNPRLSVIAVFLVTLCCVPVLMAVEEWDDHDRSGKYAARDFASNYMASCAPNAILFTNGDNDTFPLWYVQEVEGVRTDCRVVNYMLSSGTWYVHQLGRKIYDSEPLPFTLKPPQYEKGVNDYVPFIERPEFKNDTIELKDLIQFIASENPNSKYRMSNGSLISYYPVKNLKLTIDTASLVERGIVPKEMRKKMVPVLYWRIRTNHFFKNDLMLLDLIASNNWERPIYFASPTSVKDVLNLGEFFHQEGFVYRFLPVRADANDYIPGMGGIFADASYDILLNKCKWGNLNDPHVYIDPESLNNSIRPKNAFMRTAQSLLMQGKKDSAVVMCDTFIKYFPDEKITFDLYMIPYADIYYSAGAIEKGNAIVKRLLEVYDENLSYYYRCGTAYMEHYKEDIGEGMAILQRLKTLAKENKQDDLLQKAEEAYNRHLHAFYGEAPK